MKELDIYDTESIKEAGYSYVTYKWEIIRMDQFDEKLMGEINCFPSCCGYAIYTRVFIDEIQFITNWLINTLKTNKKEGVGFGSVICTVTSKKTLKELKLNKWVLINTHLNYGTQNTIYTLVLEL